MNKKFLIEAATQAFIVVVGVVIATALINNVEPVSKITSKQS